MNHLLHEYSTGQASRRPDAPALRLGDDSLTFGELEILSNRIAHALLEVGCARSDRVGLLLEKSPLAVAALIGVLKADCAYVPLDIANPPARLRKIVERCEPRVILTVAAMEQLLRKTLAPLGQGSGTMAGWLSSPCEVDCTSTAFCLDEVATFPGTPPAYRNHPDDLAYIFFTSGSTGEPKGVMITHSNVAGSCQLGE